MTKKRSFEFKEILKKIGFKLIFTEFVLMTVAYPGHLEDRYVDWGTRALAPRKHYLGFPFSVVFQQK